MVIPLHLNSPLSDFSFSTLGIPFNGPSTGGFTIAEKGQQILGNNFLSLRAFFIKCSSNLFPLLFLFKPVQKRILIPKVDSRSYLSLWHRLFRYKKTHPESSMVHFPKLWWLIDFMNDNQTGTNDLQVAIQVSSGVQQSVQVKYVVLFFLIGWFIY